MTVKTVGELKEALSSFDDNIPLDFMATFLDRGRTNYVVVDRTFEVPRGEGVKLFVYQNADYCRIENVESHDLMLDD